MEYNRQEIIGLSDGYRQQVATNTYSPCTAVDAEDVPACVTRLPAWWLHGKQRTETEADPAAHEAWFVDMGRSCRNIAVLGESVRDCFFGIGFAAYHSGPFDMRNIARLCAAASIDRDEELRCIVFAIKRVKESGFPHEYLCAAIFTDRERTYCEDYVGATRIEGRTLSLPAR